MSSQHPTATAENYSPRTKNSFFEKFKRRRTKFPLAARAAAVLQRGFWTYPPEQFFSDVVTCAGSGVRHPMRGGVRRRCASASARIATLLACLSSARVFVRTIENERAGGFSRRRASRGVVWTHGYSAFRKRTQTPSTRSFWQSRTCDMGYLACRAALVIATALSRMLRSGA